MLLPLCCRITFLVKRFKCHHCRSALTHLPICAPGLLSLWQSLVGLQGPSFQQRLILHSGLTFHTVDSITRIADMNPNAAKAGVQIGDALWEIGEANVSGIPAQEIGRFFLGPLGANGLLLFLA